MKKIVLFTLLILSSFVGFSNTTPQKSSTQTEVSQDTTFFTKFFYWHMRNTEAYRQDKEPYYSYFQVTFWLTFACSLIVMVIHLICFGNWYGNARFKMEGYIAHFWVMQTIMWQLLFWFGIFLANCGTAWFIVCGIISGIVLGCFYFHISSEEFPARVEALQNFKDAKNRYTQLYNKIKNQKLWTV